MSRIPAWLKRLLRSVFSISLGVALGLPLLLYLLQDGLLFHPQPLEPDRREWLRQTLPGSDLELDGPDGVRLHGWQVQASQTPARGWLLYFGGNAEEVSWLVPVLHQELPEWNLLLLNYRGYGLSQGRPGETALLSDALWLYDWLAARPGFDPRRLVLLGRSLGSGVAVHLAAQRPVAGVVLLSPYSSMTAVAQLHYPWLPVRWLLRHRFDSLALAPTIHAPVLALAGDADELIPPAQASTLLDAWGGPAQLQILPGADHNDIDGHPDYWPLIQQFLRER